MVVKQICRANTKAPVLAEILFYSFKKEKHVLFKKQGSVDWKSW
jgi:hypothetical protein